MPESTSTLSFCSAPAERPQPRQDLWRSFKAGDWRRRLRYCILKVCRLPARSITRLPDRFSGCWQLIAMSCSRSQEFSFERRLRAAPERRTPTGGNPLATCFATDGSMESSIDRGLKDSLPRLSTWSAILGFRTNGRPLSRRARQPSRPGSCLLYTSDAADDLLCVDLGGRRIIKKKKKNKRQSNESKN